MTKTFKTLAVATLLSTLSAPAFAAAHLDVNSMTCEEYNQLGGVDRDKAAMLAVMKLNDGGAPSDVNLKADGDVSTSTAAESNSAVSESLRSTSTADAGDDMSRFAEEIGVLNRTCARNWDATLIEAAAGMQGTR